jgi:uncharacterized protein DUF4268
LDSKRRYKGGLRALQAQKEDIEREFGEPLLWEELPGKKATRIAVYKYEVNPADEIQYPELHAWMLSKMDRFKRVFAGRVRTLPFGTAVSEDEEGPPEE